MFVRYLKQRWRWKPDNAKIVFLPHLNLSGSTLNTNTMQNVIIKLASWFHYLLQLFYFLTWHVNATALIWWIYLTSETNIIPREYQLPDRRVTSIFFPVFNEPDRWSIKQTHDKDFHFKTISTSVCFLGDGALNVNNVIRGRAELGSNILLNFDGVKPAVRFSAFKLEN